MSRSLGCRCGRFFLGGRVLRCVVENAPRKRFFLLNRPTAFPKKCHSPKVQIAHEARDSICVNAVDRFNEFLSQHPEAPDSTVELQRQALIKLGKPSFLLLEQSLALRLSKHG